MGACLEPIYLAQVCKGGCLLRAYLETSVERWVFAKILRNNKYALILLNNIKQHACPLQLKVSWTSAKDGQSWPTP